MLSRSFFFPGPLPPFTHLGCTLFRHCFHSAQRYAFYHLGEEPPEAPQIEFVHLRPYFVADRGLSTLVDWLLEPGNTENRNANARLRAALAFHRVRKRSWKSTPQKASPSEEIMPWRELRHSVSASIPTLGEALIADLDAVGRRQRLGSTGSCSSPKTESWWGTADVPALDPGAAATPHKATEPDFAPASAKRGALRDAWAECALIYRSGVLTLGQTAVAAGHIEDPQDAFFLPWDHLDLLAGDRVPEWLSSTIANNRSEWLALGDSVAPAETLENRTVGLKLQEVAPIEPPALHPLV